MAKPSRPTDDMLAASLMGGRKGKKDTLVGKQTTGFANKQNPLTQDDSGEAPKLVIWNDELGPSQQTASEAIPHKLEDDAPSNNTLHEVQSNLIDFDRPAEVPKSIQPSKTQWNIDDEDEMPVVHSRPKQIPGKQPPVIKPSKTQWNIDGEDEPQVVNVSPKQSIEEEPKAVKPSKAQWNVEGEDELQVVSSRPKQLPEEQPKAVKANKTLWDVDGEDNQPVVSSPKQLFLEDLPSVSVAEPVSQVPEIPQPSVVHDIPQVSESVVAPVATVFAAKPIKAPNDPKKLFNLSLLSLILPLALIALSIFYPSSLVLGLAAVTLLACSGFIVFASRQLVAPQVEPSVIETVKPGLPEVSLEPSQDHLELQKLEQDLSDYLSVARQLASGDLSQRGQVSVSQLGQIIASINQLTSQINNAFKRVNDNSLKMSEDTLQLQQMTRQVHDASQKQTQGLEKTSQHVQDMMKSLRLLAGHLETSAKSSEHVLQVSGQNQQTVLQTLQNMQSLHQDVQGVVEQVQQLDHYSNSIHGISETISDIASQTNLLALGAALEAAGAGEVGKRFAVVAEEVSRLAERSADSAYKVGALVHNIQREVKRVIQQVNQNSVKAEKNYQEASKLGRSLNEILSAAQQASEIHKTLHHATKGHLEGVRHIGQEVQNLNQVSQDLKASSLEGRTVAEKLQARVLELSQDVSRFKL